MTAPIKRPRRFIAGAVCPKCAEMDKLVMFSNDEGEEVRECVACGYTQTTSEQAIEDQQAAELATRVSPLDGRVIYDNEERPLKILGLTPKQ